MGWEKYHPIVKLLEKYGATEQMARLNLLVICRFVSRERGHGKPIKDKVESCK
jgi:hypothetical protein